MLRALISLVVLAATACNAPPRAPDDTRDAGHDEQVPGEGEGEGEGEGAVADAGPLWTEAVRTDRSLVWTAAAVLNDAETVSMQRLMQAVGARLSVAPGTALANLLDRFATTAHSERAGPAQLRAELSTTLGADAASWDLSAAPFIVTGVHNRIDLMSPRRPQTIADGVAVCGELRVSVASTHPLYRPFHLLFIFAQPAVEGDVDGDGTVSCQQTALRWARLSALSDAEFLLQARALLAVSLVPERFVAIETVELTVSPWEWRQWLPDDATQSLQNPPLFQQLNITAVNANGAVRDDFVAFVTQNAAALDARTLVLPARFRSPSVRVLQGVAWVAVNLDGVDSASFPQLRQHIEIVGCAACHTADADFVHTREDRTLSPFYTKELQARGQLLDDILHNLRRTLPFGPLQDAPVLQP